MQTLESPLPLAFEQTEVFTRTLASRFGRESVADKLINQARANYDRQLLQIRKYLSGKKVMIFSSTQSVDWLISTLLDLDVEIQKVCLSHLFYLRGPISSKYAGKFKIETDYPFERHEMDLLENNPDLVLMNFVPNKISSHRIPYDIFPITPTYGFYSGLAYARRWTSKLKTPSIEGWRIDERLFHSSS